MGLRFAFDNSYARLPARFHQRLAPTPVKAPATVRVNTGLAATLGLDAGALSDPAAAAIFAGNHVPEGAEPLAQAYAGHQFGQFNPQLGDGRAILLGEVVGTDGIRRDIQLKGAGPTGFSRRGDGRAALGPVLREYLVAEAMAALGIATTRALAATLTGEWVFREDALPGAVLTRVAASHLRVGTFQYFAAREDTEALRLLTAYALARHDPESADAPNPALALLRTTIARQTELIARWMLVGFIHGVMNTDNMTISGETIDYGPCAFMDGYDPNTVFSSIDHGGRYAYGNQPSIALWNLTRLAETLLPLLDPDEDAAVAVARAALGEFAGQFHAAYEAGLCRKLGFAARSADAMALAQDLLQRMKNQQADFTLTFRALAAAADGDDAPARAAFADPGAFDSWAMAWRAALARGALPPDRRAADLRAVNPAVIPRNHLVEEALAAAVTSQDFAPFERMLAVLARPFEDPVDHLRFTQPPAPHERVRATFCGT